MMNLMMDAAQKNLNVMAEFQAKNEEFVRTFLDQAAKNREQALKMSDQMIELAKQQNQTTEKYIKEMMEMARQATVPAAAGKK